MDEYPVHDMLWDVSSEVHTMQCQLFPHSPVYVIRERRPSASVVELHMAIQKFSPEFVSQEKKPVKMKVWERKLQKEENKSPEKRGRCEGKEQDGRELRIETDEEGSMKTAQQHWEVSGRIAINHAVYFTIQLPDWRYFPHRA